MALYAQRVADHPRDYAEIAVVITTQAGRCQRRITVSGPDLPTTTSGPSDFGVPVEPWEVEAVGSSLVVKQSRVSAPDISDPARDLGSRLFESLFGPSEMRLYAEAVSRTASRGLGLCLTIMSHDDVIDDLPWELAFDRTLLANFLALTPGISVLRRGTSPRVTAVARQRSATRALLVATGGADPATVRALMGAGASELASLVVAEAHTAEELSNAILEHHPTLLHVLAPGRRAPRGGPRLVLGDPDGPGSADVSAERLARILADSAGLELVLLHGPATDRIAVQAADRVPATVGFRETMSERGRLLFIREFYSALWSGLPVPAAASAGRSQVAVQSAASSDWMATVATSSSLRPLVDLAGGSPRREPGRTSPAPGRTVPGQERSVHLTRQLAIDEENRAALLEKWGTLEEPLRPATVRDQLVDLEARIDTAQAELTKLVPT